MSLAKSISCLATTAQTSAFGGMKPLGSGTSGGTNEAISAGGSAGCEISSTLTPSEYQPAYTVPPSTITWWTEYQPVSGGGTASVFSVAKVLTWTGLAGLVVSKMRTKPQGPAAKSSSATTTTLPVWFGTAL